MSPVHFTTEKSLVTSLLLIIRTLLLIEMEIVEALQCGLFIRAFHLLTHYPRRAYSSLVGFTGELTAEGIY